jgi:putative nucleotidyltransferase with HDIG domain
MLEWDEHINRAQRLPPAPRILPKLLVLLGKPDIDSGRVVRLITQDPGLTASVIQLCNSAYLGSASPVADLQEGVTRLGFRPVCQLVAAVSGSRALASEQKGYGLEAGELWRHSVSTAVVAQAIAKECGVDESLAFTAGLLHDIGKIVLASSLENRQRSLGAELDPEQRSLVEAEKTVLGASHTEIGGHLLARWSFPPNLVAAVWFHHHPAEARPHHRLASCVYLADLVSHFIGQGYGGQGLALRGRGAALEILGLDRDALPRFIIQAVERREAVNALIQASASGGASQ